MLQDVVEHLRCPHCEEDLLPAPRALGCRSGHSFDIARQGYVSLLPGDARAGTADTREMVEARGAFLGGGHFRSFAEALGAECRRRIGSVPHGALVELGAGTGYYLAAALDLQPARHGIALDISKHAARRAARAHPRIGAVVCDAWRALPLRSASAAAVISVFSPRNGAEMRRIVRTDGALLVITPAEEHLAELVAALDLVRVDERKEERLEAQLGSHFDLEQSSVHSRPLSLGHADIESLVAMGPSARHLDADELRERVGALPEPFALGASVTLSVYRPRWGYGAA